MFLPDNLLLNELTFIDHTKKFYNQRILVNNVYYDMTLEMIFTKVKCLY